MEWPTTQAARIWRIAMVFCMCSIGLMANFYPPKPFGPVTWAKGVDPEGKPIPNTELQSKQEGQRVCPGALGLTNWYSPSYSPDTKLLYLATSNECDIFTSAPQEYRAGHDFIGSVYVPDPVNGRPAR